jgi:CheY-like chemotaxis protein
VSLPAAEAEATVAGRARRVSALAPNQPAWRILVVDDTAVNRMVLTRLLDQVGFEVREASCGEEALASWRSWKPHLIWMDWRMSGVDGLEATRRIRAEERERGAPRTPIIALSASALDHERGAILAAGCDDFVAKPFREATIFAKLREHLGVEYVEEDVEVAEPAAEADVAPPRDANVLLVDDDWICREIATEALRGNGVGVTAAASGSEALELLAGEKFDLVLMDLQMPAMSGVETVRRIRSNPENARIPIIAMSADTFDGDVARLTEARMDDYITKPVDPDALLATVRRWLK